MPVAERMRAADSKAYYTVILIYLVKSFIVQVVKLRTIKLFAVVANHIL